MYLHLDTQQLSRTCLAMVLDSAVNGSVMDVRVSDIHNLVQPLTSCGSQQFILTFDIIHHLTHHSVDHLSNPKSRLHIRMSCTGVSSYKKCNVTHTLDAIFCLLSRKPGTEIYRSWQCLPRVGFAQHLWWQLRQTICTLHTSKSSLLYQWLCLPQMVCSQRPVGGCTQHSIGMLFVEHG